ncbi:MAG: hypothetical protein MJ065_08305 [Oscillospiraceae bacterium]|nr:hypothetical protein [Oscillospiraceae bacterium]
MTFASLPMILYILPLFTLAAALVPAERRQGVLALGGVTVVWATGGFAAFLLMLLQVSISWLILRLAPKRDGSHHHRADLWLYIGIGVQIVFLILGKLLLTRMLLIPLLFAALQSMECLTLRADRKMSVPALYNYLCYQFDMTRLPSGIVLSFAEAEKLQQNRKITGGMVGSGASKCIRGLFRIVCMALPMYAVVSALTPVTIFDALLKVICFYFMLYHGLGGISRIGQGIAQMLGVLLPDMFRDPILAQSPQEFCERFCTPVYAWSERMLMQHSKHNSAGCFLRLSVLLGGIGLLFGSGTSGLIWGVLAAAVLTHDICRPDHKTRHLPTQLRGLLTALLVLLSMGFLCSGSLTDSFSYYGALIGIAGISLSDTAGYLSRTYLITLLFCAAGMIPLHNQLKRLGTGKLPVRILRAAAELILLLAAYSELLSRYLRT